MNTTVQLTHSKSIAQIIKGLSIDRSWLNISYMCVKCPPKIMVKNLKNIGSKNLKLSALIGYCIGPIQISPSNQYWNDKKSVVKIPLVLLNSGLGFPSPN